MNSSKLYDQNTFYPAFLRDLRRARHIAIIESPFLTERRVFTLVPESKRLAKRGVKVIINTKPFDEHTLEMKQQAIHCVGMLQNAGVEVLMTSGHHRNLAKVWELFVQGPSCVGFNKPNHRPDRNTRRYGYKYMDVILVGVDFFDNEVGAVLGQSANYFKQIALNART